jgi:hypothetical protein
MEKIALCEIFTEAENLSLTQFVVPLLVISRSRHMAFIGLITLSHVHVWPTSVCKGMCILHILCMEG